MYTSIVCRISMISTDMYMYIYMCLVAIGTHLYPVMSCNRECLDER